MDIINFQCLLPVQQAQGKTTSIFFSVFFSQVSSQVSQAHFQMEQVGVQTLCKQQILGKAVYYHYLF